MSLSSISRRHFIRNTSLAFGSLMLPLPKGPAKLSFSTLGCPDWDLPEILVFAKKSGYQGIELRGIKKDMVLPESPWLAPDMLGQTKDMIKQSGLKVVGLGSSAQLHHTEPATADKHLAEAKQYIDLAAALGCPNVRVYPEKLTEGGDKQAAMKLIGERLLMLGDYAKARKVNVVMETHGELLYAKDLEQVLRSARHSNVGIIWDVVNMWVKTKESPASVYPILKPYIRHVHLKDMVWDGDKFNYVLFGKGVAPVREAITALQNGGYKGFYSFEWEKRWHPEIAAPELAIGAFPQAFRSMTGTV